MSSIIKVGKVQSSTGQDAVTVADSGAITANGALTASGGIANAGTITAGTLGASVGFPTGHVLQVKSTSMGDRLIIADTDPDSWIDIAGLSVQITPSSSSNKIMVFASVQGGSISNVACFLRTVRDSTAVGIGNTSGSSTRISIALKESTSYDVQSGNWNFIDSPSSTSALTYKIQVYSNGDAQVNRPSTTVDNWSVPTAHSSITVMEFTA